LLEITVQGQTVHLSVEVVNHRKQMTMVLLTSMKLERELLHQPSLNGDVTPQALE
jgi:hypothetical protein